MTTISAASILANAAANIAVAPFSGVTHVTAAQALAWLQQGVEALSAKTKQMLGEDGDFVRYTTLTTIPGVNLVTLPSDAEEVINVFWSKSDTEAYIIEKANVGDIEPSGTDARDWTEAPTFRLSGYTLELFPCPDRVQTIAVWYAGHASFASASDAFVGRLDWARWLELDLMIKCLQRKRRWTDLAQTQAIKADLEKNMFSTARKRNLAGPVRIRDADDYWGRWPY